MKHSIPAPTIHVGDAFLAFQGVVLFDDLNLTLNAGQCTCLLGASGAGKSTLLRLIANLITPEISAREQTIIRADITASNGLPISHQLAYMAQADLLLPWLSVLDNVLLGARLRKQTSVARSALTQKAKDLLNQVGLASAMHLLPQQLSGGMRQRTALVRTLIQDKPIILMDEPFSALDTITRFKLQSLTAELFKGRTVLLVTHDPLEALRLAHHIYIMAGLPAKLHAPFAFTDLPLRDPANPIVMSLQARLLKELAQTAEAHV